MQIVIEIPDETYKEKDNISFSNKATLEILCAVRKGIVLPQNATNGDIIDSIFPDAELYPNTVISKDWWNEPYRKE